ncbi:TonB-dependent receptor [Sphingomonas sp. AP4-R1]|nr:TonB-dependent receptor [Sphingomonas sp. AP4-R1]
MSGAAIILGVGVGSAPSFAQSSSSVGSSADAQQNDELVVTGTLIKNAAVASATPVQVTGSEEIRLRQSNTAEDLLKTLPGVVPSLGSSFNIGNPGFSFVDLRGLGSNRNVVLLDGQRIAPADLLGRVDLNNIPLALVARVENLTGGASTTYGADAVSGVVNFITRRDFTGVELNMSDQITSRGDGNYFRADATFGGNFAEDRGNMVLSFGYQKAKPVSQGARSFSRIAIDSFDNSPAGSSYAFPAVFDLIGQTGGRIQLRPQTGTVNNGIYAPFNFNPDNIFQLPFERYNIYSSGHYEIADGIEIYGRGIYSKNKSTTIIAASGVTGANVAIPLSNPYLPSAVRNLFCADSGFSASVCNAAASATNPADPNYRTVTESLRYRSVDLGPRIDRYETQVFDIRAGVRGALTSHIDFDVSGSYGESSNDHSQQGYMSLSRTRDALLATNTSSCLSGNTGCVPINVFGDRGSINENMAGYVSVPALSVVRSSLAQAQGQISGDVGIASPLAERPVDFAVGGSYRKYHASQSADAFKSLVGDLGLDSALTPFEGGYNVVEGFAEVIAPLVTDRPAFRNLTLETGVRYSRYSVDAPSSPKFNTTTYKAGLNWTVVDGIKLRGMYQHSVRAPNINELFSPPVSGFGNLSVDPCAGSAPVGNAALTAVCIAQGAPASRIGSIGQPASGEVNIVNSGNLALKPETANSFTLGVVLEPRNMIPGLSVTIDYFNIKITDAITALSTLDAISGCFGGVTAASASSPACLAIGRNPSTGTLDGDAATTRGLALPLTNSGRVLTDGIDLGVNYRRDVGPGLLALSFAGTWTNRAVFKASAAAVSRECAGYYSANCGTPAAPDRGALQPKYVWNQRTSYTVGPATLSLLWRHIGAMSYEPLAQLSTGPAYVGGGVDYGHIKAYNYFDLSARIEISTNYELTLSVQNLADKQPPFVGYDIGATGFNAGNTFPSTYDTLGRRFAASLRIKY